MIVDAELDADVGEGAVAVVVEEVVGLAFETAGAAHDAGSAKVAAGRWWLVRHVVVNIAGYEEVQAAIAVVVAPCRSGGPVAELDAGLFRDVGEGAVVVVVVQPVLAVVRDEDIGPAVVVVIAHDRAEAPAIVRNACFGGDIGEGAVVIVAEEGGMRRRCFPGERIPCAAIDEIDIKPAVIVVVEQSDSGADRLEDERLRRAAHHMVKGAESGFCSDVLKDHRAALDEAARGDGAVLGVEHGFMGSPGVDGHPGGLLRAGWLLCLGCVSGLIRRWRRCLAGGGRCRKQKEKQNAHVVDLLRILEDVAAREYEAVVVGVIGGCGGLEAEASDEPGARLGIVRLEGVLADDEARCQEGLDLAVAG